MRGVNMTNLDNGPYLNIATICEKVLQEKDETISLIRIVDRVTVTVAASSSPEVIPPMLLNLNAFLSFKSGTAKGRHTIKWVLEEPSGIRGSEQLLPALFEGEDRGANFILNLNVTVNQEGVYWFDIFLENQLLTRIPLRILYQRIGPQGI
jgi:hypothetical protein